jgi:hypothetical protein
LIVKGQIKVTLKNNQTVRVSKVEFTKKAVLMNDFDKPESPVFEVPKSNIEEVIFEDGTHLKGQELEEKVSSKDDIARIKISDDNDDLPKSGLPERDGRIFIEQIVTAKDSTIKKSRLYLVAKDWVSKTFVNTKSVIDYEDKEEGKLVCKGLSKQYFKAIMGSKDEIILNYTIDFTFKDGKFRIQLYNLNAVYSSISFTGERNKLLSDMKLDIDTFNNEYNAKKETKERLRKYHGQKILQVSAMVLPIFQSAIDYITKNATVSKDKDF